MHISAASSNTVIFAMAQIEIQRQRAPEPKLAIQTSTYSYKGPAALLAA